MWKKGATQINIFHLFESDEKKTISVPSAEFRGKYRYTAVLEEKQGAFQKKKKWNQ